jgi:hypothetical protein
LPVPLHLRNAPTKLMKELNYGKWYKYAHDTKRLKDWNIETLKHWSTEVFDWDNVVLGGYDTSDIDQEHFPEELKGRKYIE